jgi:adenylyl-sulfate kinase
MVGRRGLSDPSAIVWLTGLSASGKTSIARHIVGLLREFAVPSVLLDGDVLRQGLCADLGFSAADRRENIRRAGAVAALIAGSGFVAVAAFISPYREDRRRIREQAPGPFLEVHVATPLARCEARDPKGLYRRARAGELADFTGISAPYEAPAHAELVVGEEPEESVDQAAELVIARLRALGVVAR